jgi:hypothetical protein
MNPMQFSQMDLLTFNCGQMAFDEAFEYVKDGYPIRRSSWECDKFVRAKPAVDKPSVSHPRTLILIQDNLEVPWTPDQLDLFAEDWEMTK